MVKFSCTCFNQSHFDFIILAHLKNNIYYFIVLLPAPLDIHIIALR